jgi:GntR family transcriptional regulator/MocR family aminotransferase
VAGWLTARHGSATHVADRVPWSAEPDPAPPAAPAPSRTLSPGAADFADFPHGPWLAAARRALPAAPYSAFGYGDPFGSRELRTTLAEYLGRARGVIARPETVVITSGFHHGLTLLARALARSGTGAIAVEGYGLDIYRLTLNDEGLTTPPLTVDDEGARIGELDARPDIGGVLLTPAHQFPLGVALSAERRIAALEWARRTGGLILEDDYDGEFRYDRKPIGAVQGRDPDHVVYLGTASKSLGPALRLAWMVVPERLIAMVGEGKGRVETVSVTDQLTLAEFIRSGAFDRHVRARRQKYRRRREELIQALARSAPRVRVLGMSAGLQVVLELPPGGEAATVRAAEARGLVVSGMAEFRHPDQSASVPLDALVVNFSALSDSAWPAALESLCEVVADSRS